MTSKASLSRETLTEEAKHRLGAAHALPPSAGAALTRALPSLTLNIRSFTPGYLDNCARALVHEPGTASDRVPAGVRLDVVVADRAAHPTLALPTPAEPEPPLPSLEADDLDGYLDTAYGAWHLLRRDCPNAGQGLVLLDAPGRWPPWETSFPMRHFLNWGYAAQGMRLLHAATLGLGSTGVLLAGSGGAGKSGTTLTGILHGLRSVGDDYVALAHDAGGVRAYPVVKLMKQDPAGLARLGVNTHGPALGPLNWQGKHEFDPTDLAPGCLAPQLTVKAVLLPSITAEATTRLVPASAQAVMFALMPTNLGQLPGRMRQGFGFVGRLARALPGYHLTLGTEPAEVAATLARFMGKLAA